jgi:hypothetical protein
VKSAAAVVSASTGMPATAAVPSATPTAMRGRHPGGERDRERGDERQDLLLDPDTHCRFRPLQ